jgi:hypothetical protein
MLPEAVDVRGHSGLTFDDTPADDCLVPLW